MLIAVRMLTEADGMDNKSLSIGVNATLRVPYTFDRLDGITVTLDPGTRIHVDETRGIANCGNDYFEVEPSDYTISYLN